MVETKDVLFDDLIDIIKIMNRKTFMLGPKQIKKEKDKYGNRKIKAILYKYNVTTVYELHKEEIKKEISTAYKSVMKDSYGKRDISIKNKQYKRKS